MSFRRAHSFPLELIHHVFDSATDKDVLLCLTLVNKSAQIIADKALFRVFCCHLQSSAAMSDLEVAAQVGFLVELCADTASPRIVQWRAYLKIFSLTGFHSIFHNFEDLVTRVLILCTNLTAINLTRIPKACLSLQRSSLHYIRCSLFTSGALVIDVSYPIFRNMVTFHPTHLVPEGWSSRFTNALPTVARLSQLALGIASLRIGTLRIWVHALAEMLPRSVEIVILFGNTRQVHYDSDFEALIEGTLDKRFMFGVISLDEPMPWVLKADLFGGSESTEFWRGKYGDRSEEDSFWQEARDILRERNGQLTQTIPAELPIH
ncbi:hypothetical protein DL96DRAFT_1638119 [Flagelloscypha sp. PMI_526]|nr:hypothetical protein DL96DRAFT_1638119 [Flagelloscypha sp. PMI_526]